jgi:hypothetical protein
MDVEEVESKRLGESIGNDISKPFKTRQSKKEQKPNQEIKNSWKITLLITT